MEFKWKEMKLGEVINLKRGYDLPASKRLYGSVPIMASSGFNGYHNEWKVSGPGVITGRSGQLGKVFYTEDNYWPLNTTLYVEDFKGNYPKYIYYLLKTLNFEQLNAGSSVPTLNRNHAHQLKVKLPEYDLQKKIADTLFVFEEKIILNNSIIKNLEKISQTIFNNWFIDFEFPNEEGKPYKSSGGEMVESELGEIPKEWSIVKLSDITKILKKTFNPKKTNVENVIHFSLPAYDKNQLPTLDNVSTIKSNKWLLEDNCVVFSKMNPRTPRVWLPNLKNHLLNVASSEFVVLKNNSRESNSFMYNLCKSETFNEYLIAHATGSTNSRQRVTPAVALDFKMALCCKMMESYGETVMGMSETIKSLHEENAYLQQIRDSLLPKLLSGEMKIPNELEV